VEAEPMTGGLILALDEPEDGEEEGPEGRRVGAAAARPRGPGGKQPRSPSKAAKTSKSGAKAKGTGRAGGQGAKPSRAGKRRAPRRG
jgi:hypothetical protein